MHTYNTGCRYTVFEYLGRLISQANPNHTEEIVWYVLHTVVVHHTPFDSPGYRCMGAVEGFGKKVELEGNCTFLDFNGWM